MEQETLSHSPLTGFLHCTHHHGNQVSEGSGPQLCFRTLKLKSVTGRGFSISSLAFSTPPPSSQPRCPLQVALSQAAQHGAARPVWGFPDSLLGPPATKGFIWGRERARTQGSAVDEQEHQQPTDAWRAPKEELIHRGGSEEESRGGDTPGPCPSALNPPLARPSLQSWAVGEADPWGKTQVPKRCPLLSSHGG